MDQKLNRNHTALKRLGDDADDNFVPGTPEERLELAWRLTVEACSLTKHLDAESRLQRHVTRLIRRER